MLIKSKKIKKINKFELQSIYILCSSCIRQTVFKEESKMDFEKVKEMLIWKPTKLEDSLQPPLKAPFPKPENRDQFWSDFENKSFEYVAKKYGGIGFKNDAKSFLRKIKKKIKKLVVKGGKRNSSNI